MPVPDRRRVSDIDALRSLANPVRYRILGHLMAMGPQTASECAAVVGESPSNCSYHLRELARFGLVERVDTTQQADGRERPWRPVATGWEFRPDDEDANPAAAAANRGLAHLGIDDDARLAHAAVDALHAEDDAWRAATLGRTYELQVTAEELAALGEALDAHIRPYIALTREDAPPDAQPVHVTLRGFRRPGV
ncbi:MAG TPA: helix-turn-helix domain-containing protein [Candidatus Limnocylindrales bacterium]|nr:helix-turn-helix domain-containing protein [Candidatus Limnocylindrales bacterium]